LFFGPPDFATASIGKILPHPQKPGKFYTPEAFPKPQFWESNLKFFGEKAGY
jgi:hypothetical protein